MLPPKVLRLPPRERMTLSRLNPDIDMAKLFNVQVMDMHVHGTCNACSIVYQDQAKLHVKSSTEVQNPRLFHKPERSHTHPH